MVEILYQQNDSMLQDDEKTMYIHNLYNLQGKMKFYEILSYRSLIIAQYNI